MDKQEQAQRFAEIMLKQGYESDLCFDEKLYQMVAKDAWILTGAMQAELEKREPKPKGLSAIVKGFNNAAQENLAEQDAQMYGVGFIRILKKGDQLEYTRLNPKDVKLNYCNDEFQHTGYETPTDEWQPDWSQAPEWANYLAMTLAGTSYWFESTPWTSGNGWIAKGKSQLAFCDMYHKGNWKNSLRSRP